jgi:hypothetical protein
MHFLAICSPKKTKVLYFEFCASSLLFSDFVSKKPNSNNQSNQDSREDDDGLDTKGASQFGKGGSKEVKEAKSGNRQVGRVESSAKLDQRDRSKIVQATSLNGPGTSGIAEQDAELRQLISSCNTKLAEYEKLYIDFEVVACKEDIDKRGQASVKVAAAGLTKEGLKLSRFCCKNIANMSVAQLDQANGTVMHCKWQRDFANDPCAELAFSSRTLECKLLN